MADHPLHQAPALIREQLCLLSIPYWSFDGKKHRGQMVVNKRIKTAVLDAFAVMLNEGIPVSKLVPISAYDWDDERSMQDNACTSYNYRYIAGTAILSLHALGLALDINPLFNPLIKGSRVQPAGTCYNPSVDGTLTSESRTVQIFKAHGFYWGGDWQLSRGYVDYQHFDINPYHDSETIIHELRCQGFLP